MVRSERRSREGTASSTRGQGSGAERGQGSGAEEPGVRAETPSTGGDAGGRGRPPGGAGRPRRPRERRRRRVLRRPGDRLGLLRRRTGPAGAHRTPRRAPRGRGCPPVVLDAGVRGGRASRRPGAGRAEVGRRGSPVAVTRTTAAGSARPPRPGG